MDTNSLENTSNIFQIIPQGYSSIKEYMHIPVREEKVDSLQPDKIKVILFDMDGTLIDTEKYYRVCWPKAAADFGFTMTDEQALSLRSLGRPFAIAYFREMFGETADYAKIRERRKEYVAEQMAKEGIDLKPNAKQVLEDLRNAGFRLAVTTANDLERTNAYLQKLGLEDIFDDLICATMVKQGKPAPDIYRHACERLGVLPEEACVLEDSPNGVLSAYRAGCRVVMIPDQTEPDEDLKKLLAFQAKDLEEFACKMMNK